MSKRVFDLVSALVGITVLAPLLLIIAVAIKLDSRGPILFRQERVGRGGQTFRIHKFRSMVADAEALGPQITAGTDPRITRVGAFLRRHKLDELPQLIDVIAGNMSLVGPRPEVPRYVREYPAQLKAKVLSVRPGITDPVAIEFVDEGELLAGAENPDREYVEKILPLKLAKYVEYVDRRTLCSDISIILKTIAQLAGRRESGTGRD